MLNLGARKILLEHSHTHAFVIVSPCFHAAMVEGSSCEREAKMFTIWTFEYIADPCCKEIKIFMQTGRDLEMRKMINKKKYWQSWQRRMG